MSIAVDEGSCQTQRGALSHCNTRARSAVSWSVFRSDKMRGDDDPIARPGVVLGRVR